MALFSCGGAGFALGDGWYGGGAVSVGGLVAAAWLAFWRFAFPMLIELIELWMDHVENIYICVKWT